MSNSFEVLVDICDCYLYNWLPLLTDICRLWKNSRIEGFDSQRQNAETIETPGRSTRLHFNWFATLSLVSVILLSM